jgi:hypothetical protein
MRKTILFAVLFVLAATIPAGAASLAWDPSTGIVNGYRVYLDDMASSVAEVGPETATWPLPESMEIGREYLLGVSAYNQAGESAKAKIRFTYQEDIEIVLPRQPLNISINFE